MNASKEDIARKKAIDKCIEVMINSGCINNVSQAERLAESLADNGMLTIGSGEQ